MLIRVLGPSLQPGEDLADLALDFYVDGTNLESARQNARGAVLLCVGSQLYLTRMRNLLGSEEDAINSGPHVERCGLAACSKEGEGLLHVKWCLPKKPQMDRAEWWQVRVFDGELHQQLYDATTHARK